jgi:predicted phage terminase large subunit-like protein
MAALQAGVKVLLSWPRRCSMSTIRTTQPSSSGAASLTLPNRWNNQQHEWKFPSGSKLCFGHMEAEKDKFQYQSAAYQFVGFDELTQFSESQYLYLFSRQRRSAVSDIPIRMRSASNPGNVGHEWVKERFISIDSFFAHPDRFFISARLSDNPGVDAVEYRAALAKLDPVTRKQLEDGDWDILPAGNLFRRDWFEIVDAAPAQVTKCRGWDLAATEDGGDYTVGTLISRSREGIYYIEHVVRDRWGPAGVERQVVQTTRMDGRRVIVRGEQEPGASGKIVAQNWIKLLAGYDVAFMPATGEKTTRWRPFSAQCAAGNVKLVRGPWNSPWLDEMQNVPQIGVHDDQADSATVAFNELALHAPPPGYIGIG